MASASCGPTMRAPKAIMLQSLWARHSLALTGSDTQAQRMPCTLFAAMEMPTPVPQITMPRSA